MKTKKATAPKASKTKKAAKAILDHNEALTGVAPTAPAAKATKAAKTPKAAKASKPAKAAKVAKKEKRPARANTKASVVVGLLQREKGATLADLMAATDWQAHSVRGFLSAVVGKKLGLKLESKKSEAGERTYTVAP